MTLIGILLATSLVCAPVAAQFDGFDWTFDAQCGSGSLSHDTLVVVGPDGGCGGQTSSWTATAPVALTVFAKLKWSNSDAGGAGYDFPRVLLDGEVIGPAFTSVGATLFDVPAGSSFGFGVFSVDGIEGPGTLTVSELLISPTATPTLLQPGQIDDGFGAALVVLGDVDGDGLADTAVGAPRSNTINGPDSGRVYVLSGADDSELYRVDGPATDSAFGEALAVLGDIDGDGRPDFAVGAPNADGSAPGSGRVRVVSGLDGNTLLTLLGAAGGDRYGASLAGVGDTTGDGVPDLLVGAPGHDAAGLDAGLVHEISGVDGSVARTLLGAAAGDRFGWTVAAPGDVDADGRPDLLVAAPYTGTTIFGQSADVGNVFAYSGASGSTIHGWTGQLANSFFGFSLAPAGDVNGDGHADVIIGAQGVARVFSGDTGGLLFSFESTPYVVPFVGAALHRGGDLDADGVEDYVLSSGWRAVTGGGPAQLLDPAYVLVYSGRDHSPMFVVTPQQADQQFAASLATRPDTDGDGRDELLVGVPFVTSGPAIRGRLLEHTLPLRWADLGHGLAGTLGEPSLDAAGLLVADEPYALRIDGALAGSVTTLVLGLSPSMAPLKGGVLVPSPDVLVSGLPTDGAGELTLASSWPPGLPVGFELWLQFWTSDPGAPLGVSATNAVRGTTW